MTQCPDHIGRMGATLGNCDHCRRETTDAARAKELAAQVKAAIPRRQVTHKHPAPPATDVRAARQAIDSKEIQP